MAAVSDNREMYDTTRLPDNISIVKISDLCDYEKPNRRPKKSWLEPVDFDKLEIPPPDFDVPREYLLTKEQLKNNYESSLSIGNFASRLLVLMFPELFTYENARKYYNCSGSLGKKQLDPLRISLIRHYVQLLYPQATNDRVWTLEFVGKLDERCRRRDTDQRRSYQQQRRACSPDQEPDPKDSLLTAGQINVLSSGSSERGLWSPVFTPGEKQQGFLQNSSWGPFGVHPRLPSAFWIPAHGCRSEGNCPTESVCGKFCCSPSRPSLPGTFHTGKFTAAVQPLWGLQQETAGPCASPTYSSLCGGCLSSWQNGGSVALWMRAKHWRALQAPQSQEMWHSKEGKEIKQHCDLFLDNAPAKRMACFPIFYTIYLLFAQVHKLKHFKTCSCLRSSSAGRVHIYGLKQDGFVGDKVGDWSHYHMTVN